MQQVFSKNSLKKNERNEKKRNNASKNKTKVTLVYSAVLQQYQ